MGNDFIRTQNVTRVGQITVASDESGGVATLQIKHNDFETHSSIPCVQQFGFVSAAPANSAAVTLSLVGDNSAKVVVATHNAALRYTNLNAGETAIHDAFQDSIVLSKSGQIQFRIANTVVAYIDSTGLHVTGNVSANGTVNATGNLTTQADIAIAGHANYKAHTHLYQGNPTSPPNN